MCETRVQADVRYTVGISPTHPVPAAARVGLPISPHVNVFSRSTGGRQYPQFDVIEKTVTFRELPLFLQDQVLFRTCFQPSVGRVGDARRASTNLFEVGDPIKIQRHERRQHFKRASVVRSKRSQW